MEEEDSKFMDVKINSKLLVNVDSASSDFIIVSCSFNNRRYQGALLDATNRYLSCAHPDINESVKSTDTTDSTSTVAEDDKQFYNIRRRFTFFHNKILQPHQFKIPKVANKNKNQKMTVRLRPRQVLCSKCKSICNENSLNVLSEKSVKKNTENSPEKLLGSNNENNSNKSNKLNKENNNCNSETKNYLTRSVRTTLLPKLSPIRTEDDATEERCVNGAHINNIKNDNTSEDDKQMVLRKKRSVGSMEDLWDESVFEEANKQRAKNTPVIKISFGTQGEGTVLKIPSKPQLGSTSDEDINEEKNENDGKIIKKVHKKVKKESKKRLGSPLLPSDDTEKSNDTLNYKKRRHKGKHKKKRKFDDEIPILSDETSSQNKQKLSINLKRLNSNTYEKIEESTSSTKSQISENLPTPEIEENNFEVNAPSTVQNNDASQAKSAEESQTNDVTSENSSIPINKSSNCTVTPQENISTQDNNSSDSLSYESVDGVKLNVGDVVWGKVHGFPWWPGKVLNIANCSENNRWDAHVSWYGSSTSSTMPCDQLLPFLESFKTRFNKRKKSTGYREAIRLATSDATLSSNSSLFLPQTSDVSKFLETCTN